MQFTDEQIQGKVLDHLGLVQAEIKNLNLIEEIDKRLPIAEGKGSKISMGERVASMLLNGLGFMDDRLYMFPDFMKDMPVEKLFGKGIKAEDFNDDAIGRALDAIHDYGVTPLFTELAFDIGIKNNLLGRSANIDTTTLSLYGEYEAEELALKLQSTDNYTQNPHPAFGKSKAHRSDLKQMVLNLATTGSAGFPIWMEAHSGNASDKIIIQKAAESMQALCKQIDEAPDFLYVSDSAGYSNFVKYSKDMKWLSRVPENITLAKNTVQLNESNIKWIELGNGYKYHTYDEIVYNQVKQRWVLIHSEQALKRELITLGKNIKKDFDKYTKLIKSLGREEYKCEKDAKKAFEFLNIKSKFHKITAEIKPIEKYSKKGRPSKEDKPEVIGYKIECQIAEDEDKIRPVRNSKGRFILATNELDKSVIKDSNILTAYKEQAKTESGFKFIKDDTFEVDSVFLKKPERICALMMVMTLCLMIYSIAQYKVRQALIANNETVPSQTGKEIQNPTMKRICRFFKGVQVLSIYIGEKTQELVINLKDISKRIIGYFGAEAKAIYGLI